MDILQRAVRFFDRAQGQMSQATSQAARLVLSAAQVRNLETRQEDLRRQIDASVLELGKLSFERWKSAATTNDPTMIALCLQIDPLNAEYQHVLGDLTAARAAMPPAPTYAPSPSGAMLPSALASPPVLALAPPPVAFPSPTPSPPPTVDYTAAALAPPPMPTRTPQPARECPECYALVPGNNDYCPSCGMRV